MNEYLCAWVLIIRTNSHLHFYKILKMEALDGLKCYGRLWAIECRGTLLKQTCAAQEAQESASQVPTF